jgi:dienelactone hydrolase
MCTRTKVGQFSNDGRGTPKIRGRVADLRAALDALRGYGVPPAQIFLAGHSAGGWAALAVEAADPDGQNAAIALMPAFAGERTGRTEAWTALRAELAEEIAGMPAARALVYASEGDPFERPQDLAFLSAMPEVALVALAPGEVEGVPCARPDPHRLAFLDCFATQRDEILAFLAANLSR